MEHLPGIYLHFEDAYADVHAAHQELARRCYDAGPIDERTARLVKLGIAIGAQADGSVRSHARRARSEGHSAEEIRHVAVLALTTIGFPGMAAGLEWIEEVLSKEAADAA
jgi:4-carboxymuconolactone decarboxylase